MAEEFIVTTDKAGIKEFRRMRHHRDPIPGPVPAVIAPDEEDASIVVELIDDLPADDFDQHAANQVQWNGSEWEVIEEVQVRNITSAAITAGASGSETRLFARFVGNMGLCVTE